MGGCGPGRALQTTFGRYQSELQPRSDESTLRSWASHLVKLSGFSNGWFIPQQKSLQHQNSNNPLSVFDHCCCYTIIPPLICHDHIKKNRNSQCTHKAFITCNNILLHASYKIVKGFYQSERKGCTRGQGL